MKRPSIIAAAVLSLATIATTAHATPAGVEMMTTRHRVFISTDMPHCVYEDGSGGPRPCTWNLGSTKDGNGIGLAYWVGKRGGTHYIWASTPLNAHRSWVTHDQAKRFSAHADGPHHGVPFWRSCWHRNVDQPRIHCANGATYTTS